MRAPEAWSGGGRDVTVASNSAAAHVLEHSLVADDRHFTYRLDVSKNGGRSWARGQVEMEFERAE